MYYRIVNPKKLSLLNGRCYLREENAVWLVVQRFFCL